MRTRIEVSLLVVTGSVAPNGDLCAPVTGKLPQRGAWEGGFLKPQSGGLQPCT